MLYVTCGLPASGKTTYVSKLTDVVVVSSDKIREELFGDVNNQENNALVFEIMKKRTKELLKQGKSVAYDATNINRRRRIALINEFKNYKKKLFYLATPYEECLRNNELRERRLDEFVIDRMYRNFHVPLQSEGWDEITYISSPYQPRVIDHYYRRLYSSHSYEGLFLLLTNEWFPAGAKYFRAIYEIPHDNPYHTFSVSRHTYMVWKNIIENCSGKDLPVLAWSALLHDIGKPHCKQFKNYKGEETTYAHYYGHENVSAQIAYEVLKNLGFKQNFITKVVGLIQYHMFPKTQNSEKAINRVKNILGEDGYRQLMILHEADLSAK